MQPKRRNQIMAAHENCNFPDNTAGAGMIGPLSYRNRSSFQARTIRGQNDVYRQDRGSSLLQTSQEPNPEAFVSRPIYLETAHHESSFSLFPEASRMAASNIPVQNICTLAIAPNYSHSPAPWPQGAAAWEQPPAQFVDPLQTIGVQPSEDSLPSRNKTQQVRSHPANYSARRPSRLSPRQSGQPGHGNVPIQSTQANDTLMQTPSRDPESRWIVESGHIENLILHPTVGEALPRIISTKSSRSNTTATEIGDSSSSKAKVWHNLDDSKENNPTTQLERKKKRRKLTPAEREDARALRRAGGACDVCRQRKKKCCHRFQREQRFLSAEKHTNSHTISRGKASISVQSSDSRTVTNEQPLSISAERQYHRAGYPSYQLLPSETDPTVFTTTSSSGTFAPTEEENRGAPSRHGNDFEHDTLGLGKQFNEQEYHFAEELVRHPDNWMLSHWPSTSSSPKDGTGA